MTELTDRELEIMRVLWAGGEMTADEVRHGLAGRPDNSTVRTFLRILENKGHVVHHRRGRRFVFRAITSRDQALRTAVTALRDRFFEGSGPGLADWLIADADAGTKQTADQRPAADQHPAADRQPVTDQHPAADRQPGGFAEPVSPPTTAEEDEIWLL